MWPFNNPTAKLILLDSNNELFLLDANKNVITFAKIDGTLYVRINDVAVGTVHVSKERSNVTFQDVQKYFLNLIDRINERDQLSFSNVGRGISCQIYVYQEDVSGETALYEVILESTRNSWILFRFMGDKDAGGIKGLAHYLWEVAELAPLYVAGP